MIKLNNYCGKAAVAACALTLVTFVPLQAADDDYSFKVHNTTDKTITELLVSEDGKTYGHFNIGDGIKAGESETMVWDKATNSQSCHQYFKAVFEGGEESKPVKFDFCEKGLELAF